MAYLRRHQAKVATIEHNAPPPPPPPDADAQFAAAALDCAFFTDTFLTLDEPQGGDVTVVPFKLWRAQAKLLALLAVQRMLIILKARQLGISWLACAYALWRCLFQKGQVIICFSKGQSEADELIRRIAVMYERMPDWLKAALPTLRTANTSELGWSNGSRVESFPATQNAGRSFTASVVIMDEFAFILWADPLYTAVKPIIDGGGQMIIISTANGIGNPYHQLWIKAVRRLNNFRPVFLPWYERPGRDRAWYERTMADYNEPDKGLQEYPSTPTEAFLVSGRVRFKATWVMAQQRYVRQPIPEEKLPRELQGIPGLQLYTLPQHGHEYVMPCDTSEGYGDDFSVGMVLDRTTWQEMASLAGKWEPEYFAKIAWKVGKFYRALMAVERNNHGHTVLNEWKHLGVPYGRIYRARDGRPGWVTNAQTKPQMIDLLAEALHHNLTQIRTAAALDELRIYRINPNGDTGAPEGYNDDYVMTLAIGVSVARTGRQKPTRQSSYFDTQY